MPGHGAPELPAVTRLKRRADFLRAAKGARWHGGALTLQANARAPVGDAGLREGLPEPAPRVGFTLTKKVGCAVIRNRARRRLREAIRLSPDLPLRADHDYVVVGRSAALRLPFEALRDEVARAVRGVHAARTPDKAHRRPARGGSPPSGTGGNDAGRKRTRRTP